MRKCIIEILRLNSHSIATASRSQLFRYSTAPTSSKSSRLRNPAESSSFTSLFNEIAEILGTEGIQPAPEATSRNDIPVAKEAKIEISGEREKLTSCTQPVCENLSQREFQTVGSADVSPIVHEITAIVRGESGSSIPMEERLERSGLSFESHIVEKVLKRCFKVPNLALRFFEWVRHRDEFSHTTETYNTILYIAGEAKEFGLVEKLMEEMEASLCEKNIKTWSIVIDHYGKAKMIGKALLVFEKMKKSGFEPDSNVYSVMIRALCIARKADIAVEFYHEMAMKEMSPSLGLYKMLLNCVAVSGDADAVRSIADDMVRVLQISENVAYGMVLKSFCVAGRITDALETIRGIKKKGLSVDHEHFEILVKGLCRAGKVDDALEIVGIMERRGVVDGDIYGTIIDGYLKKNDVSRALDLFRSMKNRGDLISRSTYTALIQSLFRSKEYEKGTELFDEMVARGIEPDRVAFMAIVAGQVSSDDMSEARRMLKVMEEKGIEPNEKFYSVLVNELCKKGRSHEIIKVMDEIRASGVVIGDKILQRVTSYLEKKDEREALEKVREEEEVAEPNLSRPEHPAPTASDGESIKQVSKILMPSSEWSLTQEALEKLGLKFSPESVLAILRECKIHGRTALSFFDWVGKQEGYGHTSETYNMAIKIAGSGKSFKHMRSLFYEMRRNQIAITAHTWTIMIMVYGRIGLTEIALRLFEEMKSSGCEPVGSTYKYLIVSLCGRKGRKVDVAVKLFHEMIKRDYVPDKELIEEYLHCLCETDRLNDARECVGYLGKVGFSIELRYSMYIRALCRTGKLEEAQKIVNEIGAGREKLNNYVYGSFVHALLRKGRFEEALSKVEEMRWSGISPTVHVYTSLIVHFFKEKQIQKALEIFEKMKMEGCEPSVVTYSAVIRGYMNAGKVDEAKSALDNMRLKGPSPDFRTYSMFIGCLCKAERSEEALQLISEMFDRGIAPSSVNFRTVFFGLNREGKRDLARAVLRHKKDLARQRQFVT